MFFPCARICFNTIDIFRLNFRGLRVMVLNATFKSVSVTGYIVAVSFIGGGNQSTRRRPLTCRKSLANFITKCCIEYTSSWASFELTTLVVIGTDYLGSCKSKYHTNTTTTTLSIFILLQGDFRFFISKFILQI